MPPAGPAARTTIRDHGPCWSCCRACCARRDLATIRSRSPASGCAAPRGGERMMRPGGRARAFHGGFMFDLDGTLLLSDRSLGGYEVLPGAVEVLTRAARARPFPTWCSPMAAPIRRPSRPRGCASLGLPVADEQMLTPSSVTRTVMRATRRAARAGAGIRGVGHALREAGIAIAFTGERRSATRWMRCTSAGIRTAA